MILGKSYLGATEASKLYLGASQVYPTGSLIPEARFIMLGDSITQDIYASTATVKAEIEAAYPGVTAHVFEEGQDGVRAATVSDDIATRLAAYTTPEAYPTYVVINLGTNDVSDVPDALYTSASSGWKTNLIEDFNSIVAWVEAQGYIPVLNEIYHRVNSATTFNNLDEGIKPFNDNIVLPRILALTPDFAYPDGTSFYQSDVVYYNGGDAFFIDASYPYLHPSTAGINAFRTHFVDTICKKIFTGVDPIKIERDSTDVDQDGNPIYSDPNDAVVTVTADAFTAFNGEANLFNVLANDDFLPSADITLVDLGTGTAGGTISFNNLTGELSYTPLVGEIGTDVTVNYRVTYVPSGVFGEATVTISVSAGLETQALDYINAVELTRSMSALEKGAINDLIIDLNNDALIPLIKGMYITVWADADANKYNLINPLDTDAAGRITWNGAVSHDANGVLSNTTGYADTHINQRTDIGTLMTDYTYGFFSGIDNDTNSGYEMGANSFGDATFLRIDTATHSFITKNLTIAAPTRIANDGFFIGTRTSDTDMRLYRNGTQLVSDATLTSETAPNLSVYILGYNNNNNLGSASTKECRVAFLGLGMTDAKVQAINTAVQTFLTTLSKNI